MMNHITRVVLGVVLVVATPFFVSAITRDDLGQQVQTLLQQAAALQQQMSTASTSALFNLPSTTLQSVSQNTPTTTNNPTITPTSRSACPVFSGGLGIGSHGLDVAALQGFLSDDSDVYPNGKVTGYFGPLTEQAVQRFQAKFNIVTSGDPSSTGFGFVGARTRAAISAMCGGYTSGGVSCIQNSPPAQSCTTGWKPVKDTNGCTTSYKCSIPLNAPGNGSAACPALTLICGPGLHENVSPTCSHTCVAGAVINTPDVTSNNMVTSGTTTLSSISPQSGILGTQLTITGAGLLSSYDQILVDGKYALFSGAVSSDKDSSLVFTIGNVFDTTTCANNANSSTPCYPALVTPAEGQHSIAVHNGNGTSNSVYFVIERGSINSPVLTAVPLSGKAPLTVVFSGISPTPGFAMDYGDGTTPDATHCGLNCSINEAFKYTHTYTKSGIYTATFKSRSVSTGRSYDSSAVTIVVN